MKRIWKYITRSWDDEDIEYVNPRMKIFPPIVWKVFVGLVIIELLYGFIIKFLC